MAIRFGPGPVFLYECITAARRWQIYAGRSLFVATLLAALVVVWWGKARHGQVTTLAGQAQVGEAFFYGIIGTQVALVLLAAPAAAAGAICTDKARGTLAHMLVTDLSNAEIVLGKLAARLVPVLGLVASTLPVLLLGALLGGIQIDALFGAFVVTLAVAVFGCALAVTLSVWGNRTQEVLLGTYAIIALWLLAVPMWRGLAGTLPVTIPFPAWIVDSNPFLLPFAAYTRPGSVTWADYQDFLCVMLALSAALALVAVWRIRAVFVRHDNRPRVVRQRLTDSLRATALLRSLPGPALDRNPVLWREWYYGRSSGRSQLVWLLYAVGCAFFSVLAIVNAFVGRGSTGTVSAWVNGLQVSVGLLLLSISSVTALGEERVRGTLDVLLTTPLATREIVWGKWWGSFRTVPLMVVLPTLVIGAHVLGSGRAVAAVLLPAVILAYGAAITSLGLVLATGIARLGRALAITVILYVLVAAGWMFVVLAITRREHEYLMTASPFWGAGALTWEAGLDAHLYKEQASATVLWTAIYVACAAALFAATVTMFDRCVGRMRERSAAVYLRPTIPGSSEIALSK